MLVFQQIPYACFDKDGKIATNEDETWSCGEGQIGRVEDFKQQFGPNTWATACRPTLINGQVHPATVLEAGRVHRFRLVNAGIRESLALRIVKASPGRRSPRS